ncbi:MAG: hypothetical protein R2832_15000 [Rhodothermales bacterium]
MANLRVQADGNDVIFGWQTLSETGNYGFEVQHLEDGESSTRCVRPGDRVVGSTAGVSGSPCAA